MLSTELEKSSCKTYHAPGDANLLIVQKAVQSVTTSTTALVGNNTDLIVLLYYHASLDSHDLFFHPEPKKSTKYLRILNIRFIKEKLGQNICDNILFIHGCDTTSRLYGIGRGHHVVQSKQCVSSAGKSISF